jgi:hypothetical protein
LQTPLQTLAKIPFAYKRASLPCRGATVCPVYEQQHEAIEFLCGSGRFGLRQRLTGFRLTRKIVRIQTKRPDRLDASYRELVHAD